MTFINFKKEKIMSQSPQGFKTSKERGRASSALVTHCTTITGLHTSQCVGSDTVFKSQNLEGKKAGAAIVNENDHFREC